MPIRAGGRNKEEKFPLLHFSDNSDTNTTGKLFNNERINNITKGATYYVQKWPDNLGVGWLSTLFCSIFLFFLFAIIFLSTEPPAFHQRCQRSIEEKSYFVNKTIHLVHNFGNWSGNEIENYEKLTKLAPIIHLISIINEENVTEIPPSFNLTNNTLLENVTYDELFSHTPLTSVWPKLNENLLNFAGRIIELWQFGGKSFDMKTMDKTNITIPSESSILLDHKGRFLYSPQPCHVLFEQIILTLHHCNGEETIEQIIRMTLNRFCNKGGKYRRTFCHKFVIQI